MPNWLWSKSEIQDSGAPLFVSYMTLRGRKTPLPRAQVRYALDSGAFSMLDKYSGWPISAETFASDIRRIVQQLGRENISFCAPMDKMCEPWMLDKTGGTVLSHQKDTVQNFLYLQDIAPDLPWLPVLQGWEEGDYVRCLDMYREAGVKASYFGLGSVCRRQGTADAERIVERLWLEGVPRLHLFGFKQQGLERVASIPSAYSSDSLAWSYAGRRQSPCPERPGKVINCANCLHYALDWYEETRQIISVNEHTPRTIPMRLFA